MIFKDYEEINEVIIPPKKDIRYKRYEFVKFYKVQDERVMSTKLDKIFIKNGKIHANLPRYQRGRAMKENQNIRTRRYEPDLKKVFTRLGETNIFLATHN